MAQKISEIIADYLETAELDYIQRNISDYAVRVQNMFTNALESSLESSAESMTYNSTPNKGSAMQLIDGDSTTPSTNGTIPSVYLQRVDQSTTADNSSNLIANLYATMKRLEGGTGWLYSGLFYLEDDSTTGNAQSVAVTGMAYSKNNSKVWGVYGDALVLTQNGYATGGEFDATNSTGSDFTYNDVNPTGVPFTCGVWAASGGLHDNSFGVGVGSAGSQFATGIYLQLGAITDYGIDIQARPNTLIRMKSGPTTDGSTPGGIGIDCGAGALYGTGKNEGAIHLQGHKLRFGDGGYMQYNAGEGKLEFGFSDANGNDFRKGYIDFVSGVDHEL